MPNRSAAGKPQHASFAAILSVTIFPRAPCSIAATGDKAVKSKADELVAGLAECQAKLNDNGYLSAFPHRVL